MRLSKRAWVRVGLPLIILSWLLFAFAAQGDAQEEVQRWAGPLQISTPANTYKAYSHTVIADPFGYVHLFWVEIGDGGDNVIYYSRFDGTLWTAPLDIYLAENEVHTLSAATDSRGMIHLIWTSGLDFRQYSVHHRAAHIDEALNVRGWTEPRLLPMTAHFVQLQIDSRDTMHILYSDFFSPGAGVYATQSADLGQTWSEPIWLDPDIPSNAGPNALKLAIDEADRLHALWIYDEVDTNNSDWIRYSRSLDGGRSWTTPLTIDKDEGQEGKLREAMPRMAVQGDRVHVVWGVGVGSSIVRFYRDSQDGGQTWSPARRIAEFGNLNGQAGDDLAIDGSSTELLSNSLHFTGQIRYPQGIYHAAWRPDEGWTTPELLYFMAQDPSQPLGERLNPHELFLVVRGGNQLVLTFYDRSGSKPHSLYVMHRVLEQATAVAPLPYAPPASTPAPEVAPTIFPTPTPEVVEPTAVPLALISSGDPPPDVPASPGRFVWPGVMLALATVGVVVALRFLRGRLGAGRR